MNQVIGDFLRENHYMARKVVINVSEYVFQALTQTVYSDVYNPDSPLKILQGSFKGRNELDGGLVQVSYTIVSDTMLNPSISGGEQNPFNPEAKDYMFITTPTIEDALSSLRNNLYVCGLSSTVYPGSPKENPLLLDDDLNPKPMKELTEYVISKGHKRIAMIHGEQTLVTQERMNIFKQTCKEHNIEIPDEYFAEGLYHDPITSTEATTVLLDLPNPPTCIFYPED